MVYELFPEVYNEEVDKEIKQAVKAEQNACNNEIQAVSKKYNNYLYELDEWEQTQITTVPTSKMWSRTAYEWIGGIVGMMIGTIFGLFIGIYVGRKMYDNKLEELQNEARGFAAAEKAQKAETARMEYLKESQSIQALYDDKIHAIQENGAKKKNAYAQEFAEAVRIKSAEFAGSDLIKPIVKVFTDKFSQMIQNADRGSHVAQIKETMGIHVQKRRVFGKDYVFDFEKKTISAA